MAIAGVILAGGASRRYGRDKAAVKIDGKMMIAHVAARMAPQVAALSVAGAQNDYGLDFPYLLDGVYQGKGPLAGLAAGLAWAREMAASHLLTAPCDVPQLPTNLVELLGSGSPVPVALETERGIEAACALWPLSAANHIVSLLEAGENLSLRRALGDLGAHVKKIEAKELEGSFANINRPEDMKQL